VEATEHAEAAAHGMQRISQPQKRADQERSGKREEERRRRRKEGSDEPGGRG